MLKRQAFELIKTQHSFKIPVQAGTGNRNWISGFPYFFILILLPFTLPE
jgi:hypothetical protein